MGQIGWDLESERVLWRGICAPNSWHDAAGNRATHPQSLWFFLTKAWGAEAYLRANPAEPQWLYEPIHVPYTTWLQKHLLAWKLHALSGVPEQYRIASILPRGYGKTVTSTKAASLWSHLDEPNMTTLIQSATVDLSTDILKSIVSVIGGEDDGAWFTWLYGNWMQGATDRTKLALKHGYRRASNVSEPSFDISSAGIGATGYHPRQSWWDDPLEKNKLKADRTAYLRGQQEAVNASANSLHRNGLRVLTLTRYLDDDIAGRHLREEGVASWDGMDCPHMSLFDKVPFGKGTWHVFFYQTEDVLTGEPTHPRLWTKDAIAEAKRIDAEDFACQQQNDPGASEHSPLVESQIPYLYLSYQDFIWDAQVEWATVHIDTAFKDKENMGRGDDSVIVVWLKDTRNNGVLYLDTDLLRASNEWREEDFNKELVKVLLNLRRRNIFIRAITDEKEPGGKNMTYKNRVLGIVRTAGFALGDDQFIQLNRTTNKKSRIRTAVGHWSEGYARILLHRDRCTCPPPDFDPVKNTYRPVQCPHFSVPQVVKKLINQIVRVDTTQHDDLADAAADGYTSPLWRPPDISPGIPGHDGAIPLRPGDEVLKSFGKPPTDEELLQWEAERKELEEGGMLDDGLRGGSDNSIDFWQRGLPREPV